MAAQRPAPGVIPPLRKRVPELARTVVSGPVLAGGLVDSASGCCTATAPQLRDDRPFCDALLEYSRALRLLQPSLSLG
jgi:hypothetical protein